MGHKLGVASNPTGFNRVVRGLIKHYDVEAQSQGNLPVIYQ